MVLESEVDPDGSKIALLEGIVSEPAKKGRFANGAVADEDNFKKIVVIPDHLIDY